MVFFSERERERILPNIELVVVLYACTFVCLSRCKGMCRETFDLPRDDGVIGTQF